jgi:uncharacterized membrane protein
LNNSLRFELALIISGNILLIGWIAIGIQGFPWYFTILRSVLGFIYLLFIPGYALQALFFPRRMDLDSIERIALSFALSLAVLSPIALLLNWLPWGIRLWPIVISLSLFILVVTLLETIRRSRLPKDERFEINIKFDMRKWWAKQERSYRIVYILLVTTLVIATLTSFSILVLPQPADHFTEFYILGSDGMVENYPREIFVGEPISVTTGITNQEGSISRYRISVMLGDQVLEQTDPILLNDNASWEQAVEFTITNAGADQQIIFILEREFQPSPYRSLRLWMNVKQLIAP